MKIDFKNITYEKPVLKLQEVILNFGKKLSYSKDFVKTYIYFDKITASYNGNDDESPFIFEIDSCFKINVLLYLPSGKTIDLSLYNSKLDVIESYIESVEKKYKEDLAFIEERLNDEIFNTVDEAVKYFEKIKYL